ncbi:hypothetical protein FVR03_21505 [Pontibacter qinzhouensis]|uniref:Polysaccharide chain length determinant N-terminal domain-containing protein n=1 Tax=Pontibacter qinzhouensis TaxID=2603253 RepID=A0A5C8IZK0_9BACT|nr:hypothetical protein [Pontibacter qinzhouensis]TXK26766.1 hypothetical protein FVR03_21505 [Pontibacter qinzhouensis]
MAHKINFDRINRYSFSEVVASVKDFCAVFVQSKYSFMRAVGLSLFVVFVYHVLSSPEYTVSSTIYLQHKEQETPAFKASSVSATTESAEPVSLDVNALQLKGAVRKAIADLNLNVHYFAPKWLGKKEIYKQNTPVLVTLISYSPRISQHTLSVKIVDDKTFVLKEEGQIKAYLFDQLIQKPYGTFKVARGPAFKNQEQEVLVTFSDLNLLAEEYTERLTFKRKHLHQDLLTISLKDEIPERGIDFIKRMNAVYAEGYDVEKDSYKAAIGAVYSNLDSIRLEIARLDIMLEGYHQMLSERGEPVQSELPAPAAPAIAKADNLAQLQALQTLAPYVQNPVTQITIIPENLALSDALLQNLIKDFNQEQLDKLDLLRTKPEDSPPVLQSNKQLSAIQQAIVQRMGGMQQHVATQQQQPVEQPLEHHVLRVPATEAEFAALQEERQTKKTQYNYLLERREELSQLLSASKYKLLTIHKPEENVKAKSYVKNYFLAILFGLAMPLFLIKVLKW